MRDNQDRLIREYFSGSKYYGINLQVRLVSYYVEPSCSSKTYFCQNFPVSLASNFRPSNFIYYSRFPQNQNPFGKKGHNLGKTSKSVLFEIKITEENNRKKTNQQK